MGIAKLNILLANMRESFEKCDLEVLLIIPTVEPALTQKKLLVRCPNFRVELYTNIAFGIANLPFTY